MRYNYYKDRDNAGDLEYFVSKFECRIEDSREYNQYARQAPAYHKDFYDTANFRMETEILPMKAIHLTSDNLARLVAEQERMEHLERDARYVEEVWRKQIADNAVREANPAVEKAYRNYQMLLELART